MRPFGLPWLGLMSQSAFVRPSAPAQIRRDSDARRSSNWRASLIGRPLSTADAPHQAIGKAIGLAVFSSDNLSSTAYATQEILIILAMAGTAALSWVLPVSAAIVGLLVILTISYERTSSSLSDSTFRSTRRRSQSRGSMAATVSRPSGGTADFRETRRTTCLKLQNVSGVSGYTRRTLMRAHSLIEGDGRNPEDG